MPKKKETKKQSESDYSDAKYILVLFILAIIVIIFGVLVYIFSQTPGNGRSVPAINDDILIDLDAEDADRGQPAGSDDGENNVRDDGSEEESTPLPEAIGGDGEREEIEVTSDDTDDGTNTSDTADPSDSMKVGALPTDSGSIRPFTLPVDFDASQFNPRDDASRGLYGERLIREYFSRIKEKDYLSACSLLTRNICNARREIFAFENFLEQLNDGYDLELIYEANEQKEDEKIYCVRYSYLLKADLNQTPITETFQYRVQMRPDGADEISARVCERVTKDGRERPCPITTPKRYCIN